MKLEKRVFELASQTCHSYRFTACLFHFMEEVNRGMRSRLLGVIQ